MAHSAGFFVPGNPNDRLDFNSSSAELQSGLIAKPANLLFEALNSSPAPLSEEERPKLMAGPLLQALGLTGKLQEGKVGCDRHHLSCKSLPCLCHLS